MTQDRGFNLVDERWIPVVDTDGTPAMLCLRDTLVRAHELREVYDPSPLVVASLLRLLVTVVHRVLDGPQSRAGWAMAWQTGQFATPDVDAYLKKWHHRFDLFDAEAPFWQVPGLDLARAVPVAKILVERASGNNATLFDHSFDGDGSSITAAEAARGLLALQAFGLGGLMTPELKGDERSGSDAPFARPSSVWIQRRTLFQTLLANTVIYSARHQKPVATSSLDAPIWERAMAGRSRRVPHGYLDWLSWPARRVLLFRDERGSVDRAFVTSGDVVSDSFSIEGRIPMLGFKARKGKQEGWLPLRLREERALWRDSSALLGGPNAIRPPVIDEFRESMAVVGERCDPLVFTVLGVGTDQAKTFAWRHERLSLPGAYSAMPAPAAHALHSQLAKCVQLADDCAFAVRGAAQLMAAEYQCDKASGVFAKEAESAFWTAVDGEFWPTAASLADDRRDEDGEMAFGLNTLPRWSALLKTSALGALDRSAAPISRSYRGLRALASAQVSLRKRLHSQKLLGPYLRKEVKS